MSRAAVADQTHKAVRRAGRNGRYFQSQTIREELGLGEDAPEAKEMHAVLYRLKQQGIIESVDPTRKRNQYLRIAAGKEDLLRLRADARFKPARAGSEAAATSEGAQTGGSRTDLGLNGGPRRVVYLEERVERLEAMMESLLEIPELLSRMQERLEEPLLAIPGLLSKVQQRLEELVEAWT